VLSVLQNEITKQPTHLACEAGHIENMVWQPTQSQRARKTERRLSNTKQQTHVSPCSLTQLFLRRIQSDTSREETMWFVGALVHVPGSALVVLGENMIKTGNADATTSDTKPWLCKTWLQGAALFVAGKISHFIAFMFASQSLLEGLGAFMFVFNLLFATRVNKEVLANRHIYATGQHHSTHQHVTLSFTL